MKSKPGPLFLEQRAYRRRRMADAARVLPVLGAILFSVPLLWGQDGSGAALTTNVMLYLFVIWGLLVGLSAVISRKLREEETRSADNQTQSKTGV